MKKFLMLLLLVPLVYAITPEEAKDAYFNATLDVKYMKSVNLPVDSLEDALIEMHSALEGESIPKLLATANILNASGEPEKVFLAQKFYRQINESLKTGINPGTDYSFVIKKSAWIKQMREKAISSRELIQSMQGELSSANISGMNFSEVNATISRAESDFVDERYDDIAVLKAQFDAQLEDAQVQAARERAFMRLARRNLVNYVQDHWFGVLIWLIILSALGSFAFFEIRYYKALEKIKKLNLELSANADMQKKTQEDYYTDGMGSGTYRSRMDALHGKQRKLKTDLLVWEKLSESYAKFSVLGRFKRL